MDYEKMQNQFRSDRVLVMDDQDCIRKVLSAMLHELGLDVVCSNDGAEAVFLFQKNKNEGKPFTLVILDLEVPSGFGGKEVIGRILSIDPDVKVVASSGYFAEPVLANHQNYGFHAVLKKPYGFNDLVKVVKEMV